MNKIEQKKACRGYRQAELAERLFIWGNIWEETINYLMGAAKLVGTNVDW